MGRILWGAIALLIAIAAPVAGIAQTPTPSTGGGATTLSNTPDWGTAFASGAWSRPAGSSMTWVHQGTNSVTDVAGGPLILVAPPANNFTLLTENAPGGGSAAWTRQWLLTFDYGTSGLILGGVALYNSGTGNAVIYTVFMNNNTSPPYLDIGTLSGGNAGLGSYADVLRTQMWPGFKTAVLQISYDGSANYTFSWSANGYYPHTLTTKTATALSIGVADKTGLAVYPDYTSGEGADNAITLQLWSETSSTP